MTFRTTKAAGSGFRTQAAILSGRESGFLLVLLLSTDAVGSVCMSSSMRGADVLEVVSNQIRIE